MSVSDTYRIRAYRMWELINNDAGNIMVEPSFNIQVLQGNPADVIREQLTRLYELCGDRVHIVSSAVTGYGEALIQNAFGVDFGLVETVAHFRAARHFCPDVDFIIDIGGQDIKCFKIRNKCIDNISLNERARPAAARSSRRSPADGYSIEEFCKLGLFAQHPSTSARAARCS